jgi:hypothetical protein
MAPDRIVRIARDNSLERKRSPGREHKKLRGSHSRETRPMGQRGEVKTYFTKKDSL